MVENISETNRESAQRDFQDTTLAKLGGIDILEFRHCAIKADGTPAPAYIVSRFPLREDISLEDPFKRIHGSEPAVLPNVRLRLLGLKAEGAKSLDPINLALQQIESVIYPKAIE